MKQTYSVALKRTLQWICLGLLFLASSASQASLQVSPTHLFIAAERNADGITLVNTGQELLYAQVRVYQWLQLDGKDQLQPTQEIIASPPVIELGPGVNQLVRIVRTGSPPDMAERSFRIIIDELPVSYDKNITSANQPTGGLTFRLRYSIPVFIQPPQAVNLQPVLNSSLISHEGEHFIRLSNEGNSHAHIADLTWIQSDDRTTIAPGLAGYVLPGEQREWLLPKNINPKNGGDFSAKINGELRERTLVTITPTP
ncbi:molecular chaperone [Gilvimarinus agarilyticus]|uniref:fimbrial biogenesis chaperone n=1 Tax=Gilvimarinus sp. 2_MG-2023 TaxID=3062666 RepID=UPI001C089257|nr:molecular chaperone [Gilvimarinus sp. 2_MG-2023]MBU2886482.1 molecular chaperone [Gilvimarinus agarilyticus]MDO6571161.1 molecular chaperone [Gilvimarinus sp. 2_MG-2023]